MTGKTNKSVPAIVWDMNGVIVDDEPVHERCFREAIEQVFSRSLSTLEYEKYFFGKTDIQGITDYCLGNFEIFDERNIILIDELKNKLYTTYFESEVSVFADALNLIVSLDSEGYDQYVVTGSHRYEVEMTMKLLPNVFKGTIAAGDSALSAPSPDSYLACAKMANTTSNNFLLFDVSVAGIVGGNEAGCVTVGIDNGFQTSREIHKLKENADEFYLLRDLDPYLVKEIFLKYNKTLRVSMNAISKSEFVET